MDGGITVAFGSGVANEGPFLSLRPDGSDLVFASCFISRKLHYRFGFITPRKGVAMCCAEKSGKDQTEIDYDEVIEWAEAAGLDNLKRRHANADALKAQALSTLTILIAGLGGSLVYAAKTLEGDRSALTWGGSWLCVYLMILCALLVSKTLTIKNYPAVYHLPKVLAERGVTLTAQREKAIAYLNKSISEATLINNQLASDINGIRWAAIGSPIVFAIGASARNLT